MEIAAPLFRKKGKKKKADRQGETAPARGDIVIRGRTKEMDKGFQVETGVVLSPQCRCILDFKGIKYSVQILKTGWPTLLPCEKIDTTKH
jgi:hypothetical protein